MLIQWLRDWLATFKNSNVNLKGMVYNDTSGRVGGCGLCNSTYMREKGRPLNPDEFHRRQCSKFDASKDNDYGSGDEVYGKINESGFSR